MSMTEAIRAGATGRWHGIHVALGVDQRYLRNRHGPCPGCGGKDRFRFDDKDGRGTFVCGGGGNLIAGDGFDLVKHVLGVGFSTAVRLVGEVLGVHTAVTAMPLKANAVVAASMPATRHATSEHRALTESELDLWASCWPVEDIGKSYLRRRACVVPPADGDLRYHPALRHPSGYVGPGLIALVTDIITNAPITLHKTWVLPDGTKAPVEPARLLLKGCRKQGGCIRLWPDEAVSHGLGVAEGIETALALAHGLTPVWACIDAGNLGALPYLLGIGALTIAADQDVAGAKAAETCATRWTMNGAEVRIVMPAGAGADINDIARST